MLDKENAEKCDNICSIYVNFLHMRHNFHMCDFENAIICGKICDMQFLTKYAVTYSHIPN